MSRRGLNAPSVVPQTEALFLHFDFPSRRSRAVISFAVLVCAWSKLFSLGSWRLILPLERLGSCWQLASSCRSSCSSFSSRTPWLRRPIWRDLSSERPRLTSLYALFPNQQTPRSTESRRDLNAQP